jgi:hypothetical protein
LGKDVQAFADGPDHADSQTLKGHRQLLSSFAPHEQRSRCGIDNHVVAVFVAVVDDDVQVERGGDPAARTLQDVHARPLEPFRHEPALRLSLRGPACSRRTLGEKNDFPSAPSSDGRKPLDGTGLDLLQCFPEIFDRRDVSPQPALLADCQSQWAGQGGVAWCQISLPRGGGIRRRRRILSPPRLSFAEQGFSLEDQRRIHVGEYAVQVERDAKRQQRILSCLADVGRPFQGRRKRGPHQPPPRLRRSAVAEGGKARATSAKSLQKSICALTLKNRACSTEVGTSQLPADVPVAGTNDWLYVNTAALLNTL